MSDQDNFETLFAEALTELEKTAEQPPVTTEAESQTDSTSLGGDEPNKETVQEAVVENEEAKTTDESSDTKSPVTVNEEDVIALPDGTQVTVKEAVLRQADYTRKTQALAEERKAFDADRASTQSAVDYVNNLQNAWQTNQAEVVSGFISSTEDPTLILSQVIVELAKLEKIDPKFLETFGITPEVQQKWAEESKSSSELASVKARLSKFEQEKASIEAQSTAKAQEDALIAEYENQWAQIKATAGLALDPQGEAAAKLELLQYALDNEISNLKGAWKALQFEKSQNAKTTTDKKSADVEAKKLATGAITAKSSGGSVVAEKLPGTIEDAVWSAFQELNKKS